MKKILLVVAVLSIFLASNGQQAEAYKIYNSNGRKLNYKKLVKKLENADIILFGELHNNPISHWLKYEIIKYLSDNHSITIGSEIFEADNQGYLNDFVSGKIDFEALDSLARLWPNYKTDYAQITELAKHKNIKYIATNIPRRYARIVNRHGFEGLDTLSDISKSHIAPLPIDYDPELPGYAKMLKMGAMMGHQTSENFPKAQAIKDATMAHFIYKNYEEFRIFFHFHGAYHTDNYEGILWYLQRLNPELNYITISTVVQKDVFKLEEENKKRADYILVVSENLTTSY